MKKITFLLIFLMIINCWNNRHPRDIYRYPQMKSLKSFSSKSMIDNIKVGVTTFEEVLDTIDGNTYRRLTYDPLLPRFHKGKKYYIKKILHYYYESMELNIPEHSSWDNHEVIFLTIFF
jgi:hypothetical protein